jgi:predicted NUDIX family NTP pyrophosphohydrolase
MNLKSAGLIMYRWREKRVEVLLVHPGGSLWKDKDIGVWSIPKGEFGPDESPLHAAIREFKEETGWEVQGEFTPLLPVKQRKGKTVYAWLIEGDCDPLTMKCNPFVLEWPPGSGRKTEFPEVDRAEWFSLQAAMEKILKGQADLLRQVRRLLVERHPGDPPA